MVSDWFYKKVWSTKEHPHLIQLLWIIFKTTFIDILQSTPKIFSSAPLTEHILYFKLTFWFQYVFKTVLFISSLTMQLCMNQAEHIHLLCQLCCLVYCKTHAHRVAPDIVFLSKSRFFRPHSTFDTNVRNTYRDDSAVEEAAIDAASESEMHNANFWKNLFSCTYNHYLGFYHYSALLKCCMAGTFGRKLEKDSVKI